jgi:hypothetical protein
VKDKTAKAGNISLDKPQKPLLMIAEPIITLSVFHFSDKKSATKDIQPDTHVLFCLLVSRQYLDRGPQAIHATVEAVKRVSTTTTITSRVSPRRPALLACL